MFPNSLRVQRSSVLALDWIWLGFSGVFRWLWYLRDFCLLCVLICENTNQNTFLQKKQKATKLAKWKGKADVGQTKVRSERKHLQLKTGLKSEERWRLHRVAPQASIVRISLLSWLSNCVKYLRKINIRVSASPFLQIVHMGWVCECPEGGAAGRSTAFKFLALRGPHFYVFRHPPVIRYMNVPSTYKPLSF